MVVLIRECACSVLCFLSDIPVEALLCILVMFSCCCALAFLTPSLHKWSACYTLPRRPVPASTSFSFLPISLTSRPSLSFTSLLPSFLGFLQINIKGSCTLWKTSLRLCQFCSAPLSQRAVSQRVLLTDSVNGWNYAFVKFWILTLFFIWSVSLRTESSNSAWILQLRPPPVMTELINYSLCWRPSDPLLYPIW